MTDTAARGRNGGTKAGGDQGGMGYLESLPRSVVTVYIVVREERPSH